ncbi:MAG: hypothetical protein H6746_19870 [Deltaproteobacteria bacterium]|nr:hypothetical protein [Deltaproteobacteria bacterium]
MSASDRSLREALERARAWLDAQPSLPPIEARDARGAAVRCDDLPYAAACAAWLSRRCAPLAPPDPRAASWLRAASDPDGWVRFFGPAHPGWIGPDLDDTALVWSERRALTGEAPPAATLEALLACRRPGGAFDTWPSPPEDGPPSEVDAVVHANVLALLAALGDRAPDPWLVRHLASTAERPQGTVYYPDPAALTVFARRAADLGASLICPPWPGGQPSFLARCAAAGPDGAGAAIAALLAAQRPDGAFPWEPIFVGGPRTGFPTGERLDRPAFGGPLLSTALAVDALARALGLELPAPAAPAGPARAPTECGPAWLALRGPLGEDHRLASVERASTPHPVLRGPGTELELDIEPARPGQPAFREAGGWAVSYRGPRDPSPAEVGALERLASRLAALPLPDPTPSAPAAPPPAGDADALLARLEVTPPSSGPVAVHLGPDAALPALARALSVARRRGLALELVGLPHCAIPGDEAWLVPSAPERAAEPECARCVRAPRCPGPGAHRVRPRTSDTPWLPLDRLAAAWRARHATPPDALWAEFGSTLHDLGRGRVLGDTLWSPTLAVDVEGGRLSPSFRLAAFYGRRDGTRAPGAALVDALPRWAAGPAALTDGPGLREALRAAAAELPAYPGLLVEATPDGPRHAVSIYLDTDHLPPPEAARLTRSLAARLQLSAALPEEPPRLLGVSAHLDRAGLATLDLYVRLDFPAPRRWHPPSDSPAARHPDAIATVRVPPSGDPTARKWDLPFWPEATTDSALADALTLTDPADREALVALLHHPGFTLHPSTLGVRDGGRRLYLRVC